VAAGCFVGHDEGAVKDSMTDGSWARRSWKDGYLSAVPFA
jgi:hypothetical protein